MCGIAVVHDLAPGPDPRARTAESLRLGEEMLGRLHHRGPDGSGSRQVGPTWVGHTRLAIVDLDGGEQPLRSADGESWVVANGEIYNHDALRAALGGAFRTSSDSEVVLRLLEERGTPAIHDLRGMWAWCVARRDGAVVLARDPLGVKPLYWARVGDRVLAASELAAFPLALRGDVEEFPIGHWWTPASGLVSYVDLRRDPLGGEPGGPGDPGGPDGTTGTVDLAAYDTRDEAVTAVRETLVTAIEERTMADVPVGVFLSGGLDSSIVAAVLARLAARRTPGVRVHSFAAGTAGSSDLAAARVVADHLGLEHHERVYDDEDVVAVLPEVVRVIESYEPSLVRSAVPNYLLAELAARHVTVVLTGEGADELFAGYHHLRDLSADDLETALVEGLEVLHHLNLQRCDRVTMAHGLEARVPFLARELVSVAQRVPVAWKSLGADGQPRAQEKALLREAFAGWLPEEILWRRKEQFGEGSGTLDVMARQAARLVPEDDWAEHTPAGLPPARTREELAYQRIFAEHLGGIRAERVLGRFATA